MYITLVFIMFCSVVFSGTYETPKKTILAGKITNFELGKTKVNVILNIPGFSQKIIESELDDSGRFLEFIELYVPTDILISYKTNFFVLIYPGDSVNVEFDGSLAEISGLLETVKFSGSRVKTNQDVAVFQRKLFAGTLYTDWSRRLKAYKESDMRQYLQFLDTLKQKCDLLLKSFVATSEPDEDARIWAFVYLEHFYLDAVANYPKEHRMANNLSEKEWDVPLSYYDVFTKIAPVTQSMLISSYALSAIVNRYHYYYIYNHVLEDNKNNGKLHEQIDSLFVYGVINYTRDSLLRQMILTERFTQKLENFDVEMFARFKNVAESYVREPFLKVPLLSMYQEKEKRLNNPILDANAELKVVKKDSASRLIESILSINKGKVIYIDCWATWCGSCLSDMPAAQQLYLQYCNREIVFAFICTGLNEKRWFGCLDEFKLKGQHYYLDKSQSAEFNQHYGIKKIPYFFLFDRTGKLVEKSNDLRPESVKQKLDSLLR